MEECFTIKNKKQPMWIKLMIIMWCNIANFIYGIHMKDLVSCAALNGQFIESLEVHYEYIYKVYFGTKKT